jgi:hypothetical protein
MKKIYVQPINYPTVSVGTERLRFTSGPFHTDNMIFDMVAKLRNTMIENSILKHKKPYIKKLTKNNIININSKVS